MMNNFELSIIGKQVQPEEVVNNFKLQTRKHELIL